MSSYGVDFSSSDSLSSSLPPSHGSLPHPGSVPKIPGYVLNGPGKSTGFFEAVKLAVAPAAGSPAEKPRPPGNSKHKHKHKCKADKSAAAGRSRVISSFISSPSTAASTGMIDLQKQQLRGIFAAACVERTKGGELLLTKESLKEAVLMTGLVPETAMLEEFLSPPRRTVDVATFVSVAVEKLEREEEVEGGRMDDLVELFGMFDKDGSGTTDVGTIRHLMRNVLTTDNTQLTEAELAEFLKCAGLKEGDVVDSGALANNLMMGKAEGEMIVSE